MTKVKEIVERSDSIPSTTEEALIVLEEFIRVRKGTKVNLVCNTLMSAQLMPYMYVYAVAWFRDNKEYLQ